MKTITSICLSMMLLSSAVPLVSGELPPIESELRIAQYADSLGKDPEFVYVLGQLAFRSLDSLKEAVARFPKGSTLKWAPTCKGPTGLTQRQYKDLSDFCEAHGVTFVHIPSG